MEDRNRTFSDMVGLFKSWIPWRSEPSHVSRDFWMPDQSCMVCYECDSQFTLFNRRHHCRHCGRIFCSKCASNWVCTSSVEPKASPEERDKVRVCNYCFKQWEQCLVPPLDDGMHASEEDASSTSISVASFLSTTSSITCGSTCMPYTVLPQSVGLNSYHSAATESSPERQSARGIYGSNHSIDARDLSWSAHERLFYRSRSDDEDEEFGTNHFGSVTSHFSQENGYYDHFQCEEASSDYLFQKVDPDEDAADSRKSTSSPPMPNNFCYQISKEAQQMATEGLDNDISDECEAPSSMYVAGDVDIEPMDFENNGVLWLPPEPNDDEDDMEDLSFDVDDCDDAGDWGPLNRSRSSGSGESRSKDKLIEEQNGGMKNVLDSHLRALVAQLLQVENLLSEENEKENWLAIITALSWKAASLLKPDTSKGGQMDPVGYVKVKCVPSGLRSDSVVVKGVVCKKNLAVRQMASRIEKPRLLILGGALEYQRVSNTFSSIDTLLQQEIDYLKMAVAKLGAHNPDILLVEKTVSRCAQEYLLAKNISLVLNIKKTILERIARCTGAQIVPSVDYLSSPKIGYFDLFHIERLVEDHGDGVGKTFMFFEGCAKPLGCTILLRGAHVDELRKVKPVLRYGIFAAYHLARETCFLADEGASLPEIPLNSPFTVALPEKLPATDPVSQAPGSHSVGVPPKANICDLMKLQYPETRAPSCVKGSQNFSDKGSSKHPLFEYKGHQWLTLSSDADHFESPRTEICHTSSDFVDRSTKNVHSGYCEIGDSKDEMDPSSLQLEQKRVLDGQPGLKDLFSPFPADHQSILVSSSSRCVWKGAICEKAHMFRIKYYGNNDKPLGRFLHDHLFDQNYACSSCEMPAEAHVQCYTHRQGTLTISVRRLPEILLPGEMEGKIWMWHRCLRCPRDNGFPPATRRVLMSDAAWGLSFGKFLELSFSNHAAASRVASCGHSLHRDCLRFYGYGKMVACFRYASIDVFSVFLPPLQLDFSYENKKWMENEMNMVTARAELLFSEVLNQLLLLEKTYVFNVQMNNSDSRSPVTFLKGLLQDEKSKFEASLQKTMSKGLPAVDILELNQLRQQLVLQSYMWDHRIRSAASLNANVQDDVEVASTATVSGTTPKKMAIMLSGSVSDASQLKPELLNVRAAALSDVYVDSRHGNQTPLILSSMKVEDESDPIISGFKARRALSDGQSPICLSDTLDAVWTGETQGDSLSTVGVSNNSEVEDCKEDLAVSKMSRCQSPSSLSTKGSDTIDETMGWLGTPFLSFYRSYKNLLGTRHKSDTASEFDPVYLSSYRESEPQGVGCFLLPVGVNDIVIPVYEDEPTSIISYALISPDYLSQVSAAETILPMQSLDAEAFRSFLSSDDKMFESCKSVASLDDSMTSSLSTQSSLPSDPLLNQKISDATVCFEVDGPLGKVKYTCTCYYAKCFKALRETCCPSEVNYVRSLSRCKKWGAQGGKSNVFFAKTLDDRFIVKQVTKTELESFFKFAPSYFKYLTESISTRSPTCLAKILGIYQVASKQAKGGKETKMDLLVMENLLFRRNVARIYDLKGSSRSRYNPDTSGNNKVLLDQNLIEAMPTSPIFVGNKAKRLLERAVWNDTAFLASIDVMDYSLLVGVDKEKHELVVGIIDFMRQYTWDKHLETWVKASGILGGLKDTSPTVISPKQYKTRFRKAMATYFLMVPDEWSPPTAIVPSPSHSVEENSQNLQSSASPEVEN